MRVSKVSNRNAHKLSVGCGFVAHASSAAEAIAEFRRYRPDVTLIDLRLPGTNGTDVLIAIRGDFPRPRIIMLPTLDSEGDILRALRAGASAYTLKSTPKNKLLGVIRSVHDEVSIAVKNEGRGFDIKEDGGSYGPRKYRIRSWSWDLPDESPDG
jgi:DNA-binding NarL/FixJ family response regulator